SSTGWFSSHLLDSLRLRVATRFLSVYPKLGAKDLLKSVSERFEKSKWMQVLRKDSRSGEEEKEENQQNAGVSPTKCNHSELVSNDGKDEPDDDDDGDDEDEDDEIEDEEDDEELEDYELLHMAGEDGDFSLQSCYTNGENISKNYLQELFGSFPSAEAGRSKGQDADISDGEYQIYEQDSGDNDDHFDDDDY
ncbi:PREDICTED: anaphase-promoting complex subunit 15-like, partial [Nelumbo nucifera]